MTEREKLIELILQCDKENEVLNCYEERPRKMQAAKLVSDHLLANGVIVPPCKAGDVVYALWDIPTETKYIVYCAEVKKISQYKKNCRLTTVFEIEPIAFRGRRKEYQLDDFGKFVFLTKEEAERALKERSEGK